MMMTKYGGGTSGYFGELRSRGSAIRKNGKSDGSVHFMRLFETLITVMSQGSTRRGNFAPYLPVSHKDIMEMLSLRTEGCPIQDLSPGICVKNDWLHDMVDGDMDKRAIWARALETRADIGFPYLFFTDNVNNNTVDVYKNNNMFISHSNLCTEVMLPDTEEESFVCDLSSMNDLYYDDWKDTDAVELMTYFLDAVMTEFIQKAKPIQFMERTVRFAERHRALGIGQLGWHSYLQSKMIPFESMQAKNLNIEIAKNIKEKAYAASAKLALEYGEPEYLKGYGRRNTTLIAIAPTKSSSFILGQVSEGIEPNRTNYYIKDLAKGKFTIKNVYLDKLLTEKNKNNLDTWQSILMKAGSVQHLDFLDDHEKAVFKTFAEISPLETVIQAAARQKHIDQAQSLNLMIHPSIPTKEVNQLTLKAWEMGIKSLYYQISVNAAQSFSRNILACSSCES
jgi:ribonucleoside-diphosphate reductase alpha chain